MAGPARLTPTGLQPGSAETFGTYVTGTPPAKTPLTGSELVPMVQGGAVVHAPPNSAGFGPPVRTILTANQNYYVRVDGSDSNTGMANTAAGAWATLTHAAVFIAANIDFAGLAVTVNIGAGSFQGFGNRSCVGGGILQWLGAGAASTTLTAGPNDGVFNFGECFTVQVPVGAAVGIDAVKMDVPGAITVGLYATPAFVNLGNLLTSALAGITFDCTGINTFTVVQASAPLELQSLPGTITIVGGGATGASFITMSSGSIYFSQASCSITGSLAANPLVFASNEASFIVVSGTFTGAGVTGQRFQAFADGSIAQLFGPAGTLGANFFPGTVAGTADPSSFYDGFEGHIEASGLPTTTQFPIPGMGGLYKDTSGGGVYSVYNDAGTIKKVALT